MKKYEVSFYLKNNSIQPISADLHELMMENKTGVHKDTVLEMRRLKKEGKDCKHLKDQLSGFVACLCKGGRGVDYINKYYGLVVTDMDHIGEEKVHIVKAIAAGLPTVMYAFISPSGDGLKIITQTDAKDASEHECAVLQVADYYEKELDCKGKVDRGCKDACRLTYMSYDPDMYISPLLNK